jgi:hypothetical protein
MLLSITPSQRAIRDCLADQRSLWRRKTASNPRLIAPVTIKARGEKSDTSRRKRKVCIALATAFEVRIGLGRWNGRHLQIFPDKLQNSFMKTIARPETRNAARPASIVDQVKVEERRTDSSHQVSRTPAR